MNRRKGIALLLSAAMLFTMNTAVFADDEVKTVEEEVGVETVYKTSGDWYDSYSEIEEKSVKINASANKAAVDKGVFVSGVPSVIGYTGKNVSSKDIVDEFICISANGFKVPVKAVKIKTKAKDVSSNATWTISSIYNANYVVSINKAGNSVSLTKDEAKEGYKQLQTALANVKDIEFSTGVVTGYYDHIINAQSDNAKKGWSYDLRKTYGSALVVTAKGGKIKKVQKPVYVYDKLTTLRYGLVQGQSSTNRGYYVKKVKLVTLKKNKDYTISESGNAIVLDKQNYHAVLDGDTYKNFTVTW